MKPRGDILMKPFNPLSEMRCCFSKKCRELDLDAHIIAILTTPMAEKTEEEKEEIAEILLKILLRSTNERDILEKTVKTFGRNIMTEAVEYIDMLDRLTQKKEELIIILKSIGFSEAEQTDIIANLNQEKRIDDMFTFLEGKRYKVNQSEILNQTERIVNKFEAIKKTNHFKYILGSYGIRIDEADVIVQRFLPTTETQEKMMIYFKENYTKPVTRDDVWREAKKIASKQ